MKLFESRMLISCGLGCALAASVGAQGPPEQTGAYTSVSGTVSQLNYDREGEVEGFLLSDKTLVHLPPQAAARMGVAIRAGDKVEANGYGQTSPAGMQTIEARTVQDRTQGKNFTAREPGTAAPYSGTGKIAQLNYGRDGAVNGFVTDDGTLATVPPFGAENPSSIKVGATVAYTGFARQTASGRTAVDAQTLTVNGQTLTLASRGPEPPDGPGPRRRGRGPRGPNGAAPPSPPPPAEAATPAPAGRNEEPPPPPAPPAPPAPQF